MSGAVASVARVHVCGGWQRILVVIIVVVMAGALLMRGTDPVVVLGMVTGTSYIAADLAVRLLGRSDVGPADGRSERGDGR